jgi:hypothetical protein
VKYLLVRPAFEQATIIGARWCKFDMVPFLEREGVEYVDLYADKCIKPEFDLQIKGAGITAITGTGHGNEHVYTGQKYEVMLDDRKPEDVELINSRDIFINAISCKFGKTAKAWNRFIGYDDTVWFLYSGNNGISQMFFYCFHEPAKEWVRQIKKGADPKTAVYEAWKAGRAKFDYYIGVNPQCDPYLMHDRDHLVWNYNPPTPPPPKPYCILPAWLRRMFKCPY